MEFVCSQGTGSDIELVPGRCKWLPTAPLRDGLNAENEFCYMYVYVTIKSTFSDQNNYCCNHKSDESPVIHMPGP